MNYYQHSIGDYRRDTSHLSLLEHGIYRQLMDWYYLDECEIPKETQVVMRRLSARTQEEQNTVLVILKEFFLETETGWKHKRCDAVIEAYHINAEKNRTNGKLGGRPKKTQSVILGNPEESETEAKITLTSKPLTSKPVNKKHMCETSHFNEFWEIFPSIRKAAKKTCLQKWKAKNLDSIAEKIIADVRAKTPAWGEFAPMPLTYLNQERWDDGPTSSVASVPKELEGML